jgi:4-amino-4-deoxy-L-arabinose transferase-like glycosyltransferase
MSTAITTPSWQPGLTTLILVFLSLFSVTTFLSLAPHSGDDILIGHADQANLANVARNFIEGKGAVVDSVWILTKGGLDDPSIPHPEPYWSIYLATLIAAFFKLFGSTRLVLLAPAILAKTGIVVLSIWWVARLCRNNSYAILATMVLLFFSPQMLSTIAGLSDIYITLLVLSAGTALCFGISDNNKKLFMLAGMITGIGIAIKPSMILIFGLLIPYFVFYANKKWVLLNIVLFCASAMISLLPLAMYNLTSFGSVVSPGTVLVKEAHDITMASLDYNRAFYNPEPYEFSEAWKNLSPVKKSIAYLNAAFQNESQNGTVLPLWLAPFFLTALLFLIKELVENVNCREDPNLLFIAFSMLMCAGGLVLATQIVFEARYWHFLFPPIVITSVWAMSNLHKYLLVFPVIVAIFSGSSWYANAADPRKIPKVYEQVASIIPQDAIVFTSDPWEFSYHTRIRSVMLPYSDKDTVLLSLSEKYGVGYIVIFGKKIRHPKYQALIDGEFPDYLEPVKTGQRLKVFKFK